MRTNHPSILLLAGITGVSAWAPALGNNYTPKVKVYTGLVSSTTKLYSSTTTMPPLSSTYKDHIPLAQDAMSFINNSPDPFHAVQSSINALQSSGFIEWDDTSLNSKLEPGGKYYFTRNKSTLVAFTIGKHYQPGNGFKIIGSHTDSPNLKVKPYSKRTTSKDGGSSGMIQLAVECYGGGLWHTWFDRDLGISGRVFVMDEESGKIRQVRLCVCYVYMMCLTFVYWFNVSDVCPTLSIYKHHIW